MLACSLATASGAVFAETTPQTPAAPMTPPSPPRTIYPSTVPAPSVLAALRFVTLASYPVLETGFKLADEQKPQVRDLLEKAEAKFTAAYPGSAKCRPGHSWRPLYRKPMRPGCISLAQATTKADADLIVEKVKTLNALRAAADRRAEERAKPHAGEDHHDVESRACVSPRAATTSSGRQVMGLCEESRISLW